MAVLGGDAIAGETQTGTLRYLLVRPGGRTQLLVAKLVTVIVFVLLVVLVVFVVTYLEERLLLGDGPAGGEMVSLSGSTLTQQGIVGRTVVALACVVVCRLGVAAIAVCFSTLTSSSVGAALGTVGLLIAATVLLGLDAAEALHPFLPTRYWLAFVDLFLRPDPVGRRRPGTVRAARVPAAVQPGGLGQLYHQGHRRLTAGQMWRSMTSPRRGPVGWADRVLPLSVTSRRHRSV